MTSLSGKHDSIVNSFHTIVLGVYLERGTVRGSHDGAVYVISENQFLLYNAVIFSINTASVYIVSIASIQCFAVEL